MRRLTVLCVVLLCLMPGSSVGAATGATVTITVAGYVCGPPSGFTVERVTDTDISISWTPGANAENTMVRAAVGRIPESRDDGYLVYYGNGTVYNDTAVNLDEMATEVYYRAFSETNLGAWENEGASGFVEGLGVKLIAFIGLAVALMIAGFVLKKKGLMMGSGLAWFGFGLYMMGESSGSFDIYRLFGWLGLGLGIACFIWTLTVGREPTPPPRISGDADEWLGGIEDERRAIEGILGYGASRRRGQD